MFPNHVLVKKKVIKKPETEPGESEQPIFVRKKSDDGLWLSLNLTKLNEEIEYKNLKWKLLHQSYF